MKWWRAPVEVFSPPAPTNVRVRYSDGHEANVECAYIGQSADGFYEWAVISERHDLVGLRASTIPPNVALVFSVRLNNPSSR